MSMRACKARGPRCFANLDYVRQNLETLRKRGPIELAESWLERSEIDHVVELVSVPVEK